MSLIWPHTSTRIPALGVIKLTILVDPSRDMITLPSIPYCISNRTNSTFRGPSSSQFGRPFLRHRKCILRLSVLSLGVEKKIFKKKLLLFLYMTYMTTPRTRTPVP